MLLSVTETHSNSMKKKTGKQMRIKGIQANKISPYFKKSAPAEVKPLAQQLLPTANAIVASCSQSTFRSIVPSFLLSPSKLSDCVSQRKIEKQDLNLDYSRLFSKSQADEIFQILEKEVEYYTGEYTRIKVFNKWHQIPRQQVAYGDEGLTYKFSGTCLPAKSWTPLLCAIRDVIKQVSKTQYNFVLVNRYKDGNDYIGEHRDDEKDLVASVPIASLSFGQERDFVLRHKTARLKKGSQAGAIPPPPSVTLPLEHGSLLLMQPPTNDYWYHSLPKRKRAFKPRINLTFRCLHVK